MSGSGQLVVLVWQWCACPSLLVTVTLYPTALGLPTHQTRAEWVKQTSVALTFCGAHGTGEQKEKKQGSYLLTVHQLRLCKVQKFIQLLEILGNVFSCQ